MVFPRKQRWKRAVMSGYYAAARGVEMVGGGGLTVVDAGGGIKYGRL